jgi:hypothetical protein
MIPTAFVYLVVVYSICNPTCVQRTAKVPFLDAAACQTALANVQHAAGTPLATKLKFKLISAQCQ